LDYGNTPTQAGEKVMIETGGVMIKCILVLLVTVQILWGQSLKGGGEVYPNLRTHDKALQYWQSLRFGLFIHWGPVSRCGTEIGWSRGNQIPYEEYDQLYKNFNPVHFNADEWVSIAKQAGMKYLVLVTKHHDGFSLWDTDGSDYNIMASPLRRDIVREISRACKKQGLLFGTYYSILDWYHPDYPLKKNQDVWKENPNMERYLDFCRLQVKELVKKYHSKILWFDGEWEPPWTHTMGMDLYRYIRNLDDNLLINNRVDKGRAGMEGVSLSDKFAGDFATPEQQIGRYDLVTPWESCITICKQWAWKPNDELKSFKECIHTLVRTAGGDGNLLLNVGPMPDGRIEQRQVERLQEMGQWLKKYGKTIYNTRGGPIEPQSWGVTTHREKTLFVHVLQPSGDTIELPGLTEKIKTARIFSNKKAVDFQQNEKQAQLTIPMGERDETDLVIEIRLR
jgi:alpha-L-fucosidase